MVLSYGLSVYLNFIPPLLVIGLLSTIDLHCYMTKKKSNGFMYFADSRRAFYEAEAGCNFGSKRLVERAADDWKQMSHTEQEHWKTESKRRLEEQGPHHFPNSFTYHLSRPKQRVMSQLERELIERARERGVDRATARQTLTDKLLWREKGEATIRMLRWALIVLSKDSAGVIPNEICAVVMENAKVVGEMRLIRRGFQPKPSRNAQNVRNITWDPSLPSEIPEHQMSRLGIAMHWMKQTRDAYCRRDTSTMRLDRIMCLEDIITVFRQVNEKSTIDVEEDEQYEQLRDLELSDTILFARAAAEYFARVMKMCTAQTSTTAIQRTHQMDTSASSSSTEEGTAVQARGDSCWSLGPPICSDVKGPELYPILFEPPKRRIFGKLASNPFNKPANTQPPEPELSHVARWLDTIRLDDIEEYHEPFPEPYDDSDEAAGTYSTDVVCDS
nr:Protein ZK1128.3 [Haemonchus contortus]